MAGKIIILIVLLSTIACEQSDQSLPVNSSKYSLATSDSSHYLSFFQPFDSTQKEIIEDSFFQRYFGTNLFYLQEPVLAHEGDDIFRLLLIRSFHNPMTFTITTKQGKCILRIKKLNRDPFYDNTRRIGNNEVAEHTNLGFKIDTGYIVSKSGEVDTIFTAKRKRHASIILDSTIVLSKKLCLDFDKLIDTTAYWDATPYYWENGTDGAAWIMESRKNGRYKFVIRHSPIEFFQLGEWLVSVSGLNEEVY